MTGMSSCGDGRIRQVTLGNGIQVGIENLDAIIDRVAEKQIEDEEALGAALLILVKECNYVPESAEGMYARALVKVYEKKYGDGVSRDIPEPKKKHAG